jgi:hypothetical protein
MGIPIALRQETIPEDTGLPYQFTQNQMSRQGTAGRARFTRGFRGRSAYTGHRPMAAPFQGTADDSMRSLERFGNKGFPGNRDNGAQGGPGDAAGGYDNLNAAMSTDLAGYMGGQVMGDIFGPTAVSSGMTGLTTGAMAGGMASQFGASAGKAAEFGITQGGKAAVQSAASPTSLAGIMGRGLAATGRGAIAQAAYDKSRKSGKDHVAALMDAETAYNQTGTMGALGGLLGRVSEAYSTGESARQAQAQHDWGRAGTMASLDPEARNMTQKELFAQLQQARTLTQTPAVGIDQGTGFADQTSHDSTGNPADVSPGYGDTRSGGTDRDSDGPAGGGMMDGPGGGHGAGDSSGRGDPGDGFGYW